MNPAKNNKKGQAMIETVVILPLFFIILFFVIEFSFLTIAQRLNQWACFQMARLLLPHKDNHAAGIKAQIETRRILQKIPFQKTSPLMSWDHSLKEITVQISQTIFLMGRSHEIKNKCTLYK